MFPADAVGLNTGASARNGELGVVVDAPRRGGKYRRRDGLPRRRLLLRGAGRAANRWDC